MEADTPTARPPRLSLSASILRVGAAVLVFALIICGAGMWYVRHSTQVDEAEIQAQITRGKKAQATVRELVVKTGGDMNKLTPDESRKLQALLGARWPEAYETTAGAVESRKGKKRQAAVAGSLDSEL